MLGFDVYDLKYMFLIFMCQSKTLLYFLVEINLEEKQEQLKKPWVDLLDFITKNGTKLARKWFKNYKTLQTLSGFSKNPFFQPFFVLLSRK